jgi:hypothetical protein
MIHARRSIVFAAALVAAGAPALRAGADLCLGLRRNDKTNRPVDPSVQKPNLGQVIHETGYVDPAAPQLAPNIIRITNVAQSHPSSSGIKPVYSTMQAWNADETYFVLYRLGGGHMLFNGKTYAVVRNDMPIDPPDLEHVFWHATDPDVLYWVDGHILRRYRPSTNANQQVRDFALDDNGQPFCTGQVHSGSDPVYNSWDSNFFPFMCSNPRVVFTYDVANNRILRRINTTADLPPQVAPSGTRTLWYRGVTDMSLNYQRSIATVEFDSHASFGQTEDGRDFYATVAWEAPDRVGCLEPEPAGCVNATFRGTNDNDYAGNLVVFDLADTVHNPITPRVVIGPKTGYQDPQTTHLSAVSHKNKGWVLVTVDDEEDNPNGTDLLDQELIYAYLGPDDPATGLHDGDVCRVAHHRSHGKGNRQLPPGVEPYFAEAHGSPSPSGTRILFGSDWGGGPTIDTYVVELPGYNSGIPSDALAPARPRGLRLR